MNFKNQLSVIETLIQGDEIDIRIDCPFCKNLNTLTIKKENSKLMWYCFHAGCSAKGKVASEASMADVLSLLSRTKKTNAEKKTFSIPKNFVSVFSTEKCTDYLKKNNCMVTKSTHLYAAVMTQVFLLKTVLVPVLYHICILVLH